MTSSSEQPKHKTFIIYDDELDAFELAIPKEERTLDYEAVRQRPHPTPARLADQKAPICENCGLDSATCKRDMSVCLQAQNAAARKAREDVLLEKLKIADSLIERFNKPNLDDMQTGFLNGLLYARSKI